MRLEENTMPAVGFVSGGRGQRRGSGRTVCNDCVNTVDGGTIPSARKRDSTMRAFLLSVVVCVLAVAPGFADDEKKDKAVREVELKDVKVEPAKDGKVAEPTKITTEDELKKAVGEEAAKTLAKGVDFQKEYLLLFRWAGSGQDKLSAKSEKGDKATVVTFTLKPGLTRDLRPHAHLYAVEKAAEWKVAK